MTKRWGAALGCLLGALATTAGAAGLRVTPLRLDLSTRQNSAQIELTNFTSGAMPVQVSVVSWSQADGRDSYTPSKDIFFAPPIVSVPASGKAVVRFRLRGAAAPNVERAYRVYFQEVAPPQPTNQGGMAFRLKLGVPLFVAAATATVPRLEIGRRASTGGLELTLANSGSAHLKIHGIEVYPADVDRRKPANAVGRATHSTQDTNYLLPGSRQTWSVALPPTTDPARHVVLLRTNDYSGKAAPGMTPAGWLWLPLIGESAQGGRDSPR